MAKQKTPFVDYSELLHRTHMQDEDSDEGPGKFSIRALHYSGMTGVNKINKRPSLLNKASNKYLKRTSKAERASIAQRLSKATNTRLS